MAVRDKIAGEAEAIHEKIAEEAADDNTIDPSVELAILEAAELAVDPSIEAILVAEERIDEFSVDRLRLYKAAERSTKKLRDLGSNPSRSKTLECL